MLCYAQVNSIVTTKNKVTALFHSLDIDIVHYKLSVVQFRGLWPGDHLFKIDQGPFHFSSNAFNIGFPIIKTPLH